MALPPGYGAPKPKPVAGSLDDPWARLRRASDQIETLDRDYGIRRHLKPYRTRHEVVDGAYRFFLLEDVPPIDDAVPFIISECAFNIRSALDQLVYQLHLRAYRGSIPDKVAGASAFPIVEQHSKKSTQDTAKWPEIANLGKRERNLIRLYQPCVQRADRRYNDARSTLHVLNALCNVDKHRRLHVVRAIPAPVFKQEAVALGFSQTIWNNTEMRCGDLVETWTPVTVEARGQPEPEQFCWPQVVVDLPELGCVVYVNIFLRQALGHAAAIVRRFNTTFGYVGWQRYNSRTI